MQGYIDSELGVSGERGVVSARCKGSNRKVGRVEKNVEVLSIRNLVEGDVASTGCIDPQGDQVK